MSKKMQQILLFNHCCLNLSPEAINQATNRFSSKNVQNLHGRYLTLMSSSNVAIVKQTTLAIGQKISDKKARNNFV